MLKVMEVFWAMLMKTEITIEDPVVKFLFVTPTSDSLSILQHRKQKLSNGRQDFNFA